MNVFVLIRDGKGTDITGRFDCRHGKIQCGSIVTDTFGEQYVVDNIVITPCEPDEMVYVHLSSQRHS